MDLDIPAWGAYALIIVISAFSAVGRVERLLDKVPWRWTYAESYLLLLIFFGLPIGIFWCLDRVGAVHDSSCISAFIVALTYYAIVNDESSIKNSAVSAVFKPIFDWTKTIPTRLGDRIIGAEAELTAAVAASVARNVTLLPILEEWVSDHSSDVATLLVRMQEFDQANPRPAGPISSPADRMWAKGKAQRLLFFVDRGLWTRFRLASHGLVGRVFVLRGIFRLDRTIRWAAPTGLLLLMLYAVLVWLAGPPGSERNQWSARTMLQSLSVDNVMSRYYSWRYLKPGNTPSDVQRALQYLSMNLDLEIPPCRDDLLCPPQAMPTPAAPKPYSSAIRNVLLEKDLTTPLAGDLLRSVMSGRLNRKHLDTSCAALQLITAALRSQNVEVRALLNDTLGEAAAVLWEPANSASHKVHVDQVDIDAQAGSIAIENSAVAWIDYLNAHCIQQTPPTTATEPPPNPPESVPPSIVLSDVNFEFDSSRLLPSAFPPLETAAAGLKERANLRADILGYTDSIGTPHYNLNLSARRAYAVCSYLTRKGVSAEILAVYGRGMADPVASNDSAEGREKNRRVTIQMQLADNWRGASTHACKST